MRLEGWARAPACCPCFETLRCASLLSMRWFSNETRPGTEIRTRHATLRCYGDARPTQLARVVGHRGVPMLRVCGLLLAAAVAFAPCAHAQSKEDAQKMLVGLYLISIAVDACDLDITKE